MTVSGLPDQSQAWHGIGITDRGRIRTSNQDALAVLNEYSVWVVADGMGGRAGGDVASRITVDCVTAQLSSRLNPLTTTSPDIPDRCEILRRIIHLSNDAVRAEADRHPELFGMGTTLVILMIVPYPTPTAVVAHVGDSRAYCFRQGLLSQLTHDHTFVEDSVRNGLLTEAEALDHPLRHVLTRAVGAEREVEPDIAVHQLSPEDLLLLCTDGLTKMLPDRIISKILLHMEGGLFDAGRALVDEANARGGDDNTTVVLVRKELTKEP